MSRHASTMSLLEVREAARRLPLGHYGREEAELAVEAEYAACFAWERKLIAKYKTPKNKVGLQEACQEVTKICDRLGARYPTKIYFNYDCGSAYAFSRGRELFFSDSTVALRVVFHELAHFLKREDRSGGTAHGDSFMEYEELVWEAASRAP